MTPEEAVRLTTDAFETNKSPNLLSNYIHFGGLSGLVVSGSTLLAERIASADLKTSLITALALVGSGLTALATSNDHRTVAAIQKALKDRTTYANFAEDYLQEHIIPRFVESFGIDDEELGIPITGVSSEALFLYMSAAILDHSATFQAKIPDSLPATGNPKGIVENVFNFIELPKVNRDLAQRMRDSASEQLASRSTGQKVMEGNWDISEIQNAGTLLGDLVGDLIAYEIRYGWEIFEHNQIKNWLDEARSVIRLRRMNEQFEALDQQRVLVDLFRVRDVIQTAILKIANDHRDKDKPLLR